MREPVVIARPVEEVFRRLATEFFVTRTAAIARAAPPGTPISVEQTSAGPVGVGTTGREVVELNGQRSEWIYQVTAYDPPRRFARLATSPQYVLRIQVRSDLAPVPGGTHLTMTSDLALRGWWRFFTLLYVPRYQGYVRGAGAQLKTFLEA